jgi:2-amino-4-hydroxy-6-hydroxymethyldihydropteridine diphosphokinase
MVTAYIGIGSNVGERLSNLQAAITALKKTGIVEQVSPVYRTAPIGPKQRDFLNAVVALRTALEPQELLRELKNIETEMGRPQVDLRWGPRIIDLDILLAGKAVVSTPSLKIPHAEMHERLFVLVPLSDIAPNTVHPVKKKQIATLRDELINRHTGQKVVPWKKQ